MSKYLTKEEQYQVYTYYVGTDFKLGTAYLSPLPQSVRGKIDRFSSFNIYETVNGNLRWKDFGGGGEMFGDAIDFIIFMEPNIKSLPSKFQFKAALTHFKQKIRNSVFVSPNVILDQINKHTINKNKQIKPVPKYDLEFTKSERAYWCDHPLYIDFKELVDTRTYALRGIDWGNGLMYPSTDTDPAFIYDLSENGDMSSWKTYRPLTKDRRRKWKSWNLTKIPFDGYFLLPETAENLLFTSGRKDGYVAKKALEDESDSWAFGSPIAEGAFRSILPYQNELNGRFKNIYVLFDGDSAGIKATNAFVELTGWIPIFLNYPIKTGKRLKNALKSKYTKDITEIVESYNYKRVTTSLIQAVH